MCELEIRNSKQIQIIKRRNIPNWFVSDFSDLRSVLFAMGLFWISSFEFGISIQDER